MSPGAGGAALRRSARARVAAGLLCLLQSLVLFGFGVFYLVELVLGAGADRTRVLASAVLILASAAGLALLGRMWLRTSGRPATPTVVWAVLLVPVAAAMAQSGQLLICVALLGLVLVSLVAVAVASSGDALGRG